MSKVERLTIERINQMKAGLVVPRPLIEKLGVHVDDRGSLFEVLHNFELPGYEKGAPEFGQVYIVRSPIRGTIRGFHRHLRLWDYFCVVHGRAKVVCVLPKYGDGEPVADEVWDTVLCAEAPSMLVVPPTLYHGWEALSDDVVFLSVASELYSRLTPDEERIPFDSFGNVWGVKPK